MTVSLVLFDIEHWLMAHFEGITYVCNLYSVISQNNDKKVNREKMAKNLLI